MTITDQRMPHGCAISVLSLAVLWLKLEKRDKISYDMTQIPRILTIATVFTGSSILIRRVAYSRVRNTCARTWAENGRGGFIREGGRISGILRYTFLNSDALRVTYFLFRRAVIIVLSCALL